MTNFLEKIKENFVEGTMSIILKKIEDFISLVGGRSWRKRSTYVVNADRGKPRRCQRFPDPNYYIKQFVQNGHTQPEIALDW